MSKAGKSGRVAGSPAIVANPATATVERVEADPATVREIRTAERTRDQARARRERDIVDVSRSAPPAAAPSGQRAPPTPPTPEQALRAPYVETDTYDRTADGRNHRIGRAFQRQARFESIEGLSLEQLRALRFYRAAFDRSEQSQTKSALDIRARGSGGAGAEAAISRLEDTAFARCEVERMEAGVPQALLWVLRAVALHDADFKRAAIERFGGRDVQRIDVSKRHPKVVTSIEPRSGRHRAKVREDFLLATTMLIEITRPMRSTQPAASEPEPSADAPERQEQITPQPNAKPVDPAFLDESGRMLSWAEIAEIIRGRHPGDAR